MSRTRQMQPKTNVAGRSFVFNLVFVLINCCALAALLLGFHPSFHSGSLFLKILGLSLLIFSLAGVIVFKGRMMMGVISRLLIGSVFVVSGVIKANDPVGFSYKLQEYFEDGALAYRIKELFSWPEFSLAFFENYALGISVFICILEIVLGVLTIFNQKMKMVSGLVLVLMLFFTFLTWHTATCSGEKKFMDRDTYALDDPIGLNKLKLAKEQAGLTVVSTQPKIVVDELKTPQCVNDCGCFGDAMKGSVGRSLTPHESLWKDLLLLYFSIWLFLSALKRNKVEREDRTFLWVGSLVIIAGLSVVFSWVFPLLFAVVTVFGSIWLLRNERENTSAFGKVTTFVVFLSLLFITYVLLYEPLKDYRPYAVGNNLYEKMHDGREGVFRDVLVFKNRETGETRAYDRSSNAFNTSRIWENKAWKNIATHSEEIVPLKLPSISEQFNPFVLLSDLTPAELSLSNIAKEKEKAIEQMLSVKKSSNDSLMLLPLKSFTLSMYPPEEFVIQDTFLMQNNAVKEIYIRDWLFEAPQVIVVVARNLNRANWSKIMDIKRLLKAAKTDEIPMILLTSSNKSEIIQFRKKYGIDISIFTNDETELKAIARSSPSLLVLQNGTVKGKYPWRALPDYNWLKTKVLK